MKKLFLWGLVLCLGQLEAQKTKIAIIVNPQNSFNFDTDKKIKDIWMLKMKLDEDNYAAPVNKVTTSQEAIVFYHKILNLSTTQVKTYFTNKQYADAVLPPVEFESDEEVISYVSDKKYAIGYVNFSSINSVNKAKVKIIQITDKYKSFPFSDNGDIIVEKSENNNTGQVSIQIQDTIKNEKPTMLKEELTSTIAPTTISEIQIYSAEEDKPISLTYCAVKSKDDKIIFSNYTDAEGKINTPFMVNSAYKLDLPVYNLSFTIVINSSEDQIYRLQIPVEEESSPVKTTSERPKPTMPQKKAQSNAVKGKKLDDNKPIKPAVKSKTKKEPSPTKLLPTDVH